MSLIASRQPKKYRWGTGDLISAAEACALLGYKSSRNLQDKQRRAAMLIEFSLHDCTLTLDIIIGGQQRFLRSEIDEFLTAKVEAAQMSRKNRTRDLRLAA